MAAGGSAENEGSGGGGEGSGGGAGPPGGYRPQVGAPAEDDLRSFGLHSEAALATVPDNMLVRAAGDDITFVFSNQVAGKEVAAPPPAGAAAGAGVAAKGATTAGAGGVPRAAGAAAGQGQGGPGGALRVQPAAQAVAATAAAPLADAASRVNVQAAAGPAGMTPAKQQKQQHPQRQLPVASTAAGGALHKRPRLLAGARLVARPPPMDESGSDDFV
jgi:DNA repair and recombination RAD54-like protein